MPVFQRSAILQHEAWLEILLCSGHGRSPTDAIGTACSREAAFGRLHQSKQLCSFVKFLVQRCCLVARARASEPPTHPLVLLSCSPSHLTCPCTNCLPPQGYRFYLIVFYVLVATLFTSTGICIWVGWCFKNDSFPFLWPIKVARIVVSLFVSMFYIASLNIFLIALQCKPEYDDAGVKHWMHLIYHLGRPLSCQHADKQLIITGCLVNSC